MAQERFESLDHGIDLLLPFWCRGPSFDFELLTALERRHECTQGKRWVGSSQPPRLRILRCGIFLLIFSAPLFLKIPPMLQQGL